LVAGNAVGVDDQPSARRFKALVVGGGADQLSQVSAVDVGDATSLHHRSVQPARRATVERLRLKRHE